MSGWELVSRSPAETRAIGVTLGDLARPGDTFLLRGDLGAGKTTLVQGIAAGLGARARVTSPTFILVNEYRGRLPLYHVDLYRLASAESVATIGLEDYLEGDGVAAIEWPERAMDLVPEEHLEITLEHAGEERRRLRFEPVGRRFVELVEQVRARVQAR